MIRRVLFFFLVATFARADLPYLNFSSDVQRPEDEFYINRVYSGNTPMLRWIVTDNNAPADLTNWTFRLWYAADNYATQGWTVAQSSVSSNAVIFASVTNFFAIPNDNYYCSVIGTHVGGAVKTWAVGRMNQKWDFATGSPSTNLTGFASTTLNWSVFSSYSGTWPFFAGSNITITSASSGLTFAALIPSSVITGNQDNAILGGLTISNALTVNGAINANDNIDVAASKHLRFLDGNGTNRVSLDGLYGRLIISGAVDIVTTKTNPFTINGIALTATPLYVESDPIWTAASSSYATAISRAFTNLVAAGSSRLTTTNNTINFNATGLATGTPLYVETDPVWTNASTGYYTRIQSDAKYATGTPVYVAASTSVTPANLLANGGAGVSTSTFYLGKWGDVVSNALGGIGAGATNIALAVGAGNSNLSLSIGAGASNLSLTIASALSNQISGVSLGATSLTLSAWATASSALSAVNSKLSTSTWAAANSTTNYVRRTGDTMTGALTVTGGVITAGGGINSYNDIEIISGGGFIGNGAGLTNLDLSPYASTGLAWNGSALVVTNVASGGGSGADTNSVGMIATNVVNAALPGIAISTATTATTKFNLIDGQTTILALYGGAARSSGVAQQQVGGRIVLYATNATIPGSVVINSASATGSVSFGSAQQLSITSPNGVSFNNAPITNVASVQITNGIMTAGSETFAMPIYAASRNNRVTVNSSFSNIVNEMDNFVDIRTASNFVMRLYALQTNAWQNRDILSLWNYDQQATPTNLYPFGFGIRTTWGAHSITNADYQAVLKTSARGTNNLAHDFIVGVSTPLANGIRVHTVFKSEGDLLVTGRVTAASFAGDGSALTNIPSSGSVTLTTNQQLRASWHIGDWQAASDVATGAGIALAAEVYATTETVSRAVARTTLTNQTRAFTASGFALSSVATNHGTVSVVYSPGAGATNVIQFMPRGGTNVLLSWTLTTGGVYSASGTNFAGNRAIDILFTATVTGQGGTNYGRAWMPAVWSAEQ